MDDLDRAQLQEERFLEAARSYRMHEPEASWTGFCLNCREPVTSPGRWCDAGCRDEWQQKTERR